MSPLDILAKAGEIALRFGPEVVKAWKLIEQSLRAEVPELNREPLPALDEEYDRLRAEALKRGVAAESEAPPSPREYGAGGWKDTDE